MGKLTNLLKWKKTIAIRDEKGLLVKDEEGKPVVVYMRVIGDKDLEDAAQKARFASAKKRADLASTTSEQYVANVQVFDQASEEQAIEMILQGRGANWTAEAYSVVTVPDLPKLEETAQDPDAPTLEEMEKFDTLRDEIEMGYRQELINFVSTRERTLRAELAPKSLEELRELAKKEVVVVLSIQAYLDTLADEKTWRSVYQDDQFTIREFQSIEEFQNLNITLKEQLREEYSTLEAGLDNVKN
jgi:hypothetical protein